MHESVIHADMQCEWLFNQTQKPKSEVWHLDSKQTDRLRHDSKRLKVWKNVTDKGQVITNKR